MKKDYVRSLFDSVAYRYDLLNHLLSGGVDLYWRRSSIELLRPFAPKKILDVATGTGDLAIASLRLDPTEIVGVDLSENMLRQARKKLDKRKLSSRIRIEQGEAEQLPAGDNAFDAAIVAFGVRNFEDLKAGLAEMHRVIRPGGAIMVLEFSRPRAFPFKQVYYLYFLHLLPLIGRIVSRNPGAYRYLPDTVLKFPDGSDFVQLLRAAGFEDVTERRMTLGIVTAYLGKKPG